MAKRSEGAQEPKLFVPLYSFVLATTSGYYIYIINKDGDGAPNEYPVVIL